MQFDSYTLVRTYMHVVRTYTFTNYLSIKIQPYTASDIYTQYQIDITSVHPEYDLPRFYTCICGRGRVGGIRRHGGWWQGAGVRGGGSGSLAENMVHNTHSPAGGVPDMPFPSSFEPCGPPAYTLCWGAHVTICVFHKHIIFKFVTKQKWSQVPTGPRCVMGALSA